MRVGAAGKASHARVILVKRDLHPVRKLDLVFAFIDNIYKYIGLYTTLILDIAWYW